MPLTTAQLTAIRTFVQGSTNPQIVDARTRGDTFLLAQLLNQTASPTTLAWRTSMPVEEVDDAPDYSTFDSIVAGKRDSWGFFLARPRNFGRNKVRKWVTDVWGSATAGSSAVAILQAATEPATVAQVAIGGTQKTTGTVSALDRSFTGTISQEDAQAILAP